MPYITGAPQRYNDSLPIISGSQSANPDEKLCYAVATEAMNATWHYLPTPENLQYNALHTLPTLGYGFERDWQSCREGWRAPTSGLEGCEQAGYHSAFYSGHCQAYCYDGTSYGTAAASRPPPWRQGSRSDYSALQAATPEEGEIVERPNVYQQQYAPFYFEYQPYQQNAQIGCEPRTWLTQQWPAADNALPLSPPPPSHESANDLNVNAPAFKSQRPPKSVIARDLDKIFGVNKKSRYHETRSKAKHNQLAPGDKDTSRQPPSDGYIHTRATRQNHVEKHFLNNSDKRKPTANLPPQSVRSQLSSQAPQSILKQRVRNLSLSSSPQTEVSKIHVMPQPSPSVMYLQQANEEPVNMDAGRPLLVVLDLNGTLLHRKGRGTVFTSRPRVSEFLHYLFNNHHVLVWSSAMPVNVNGMCEKLLTTDQRNLLIACWARDKLRIPAHAYREKVQVYKQLSWIWKDKEIQAANPDPVDFWSQENTVLIDDSFEKAASEPYSVIALEEFEGREEQMKTDVLGEVARYLDILRSQRNVSAYMRRSPFKFDVEGEPFDWTPIINDMH